jgi:arginase
MAANGWDVIVFPWHLDEHLPAFPVPAAAAATVVPPLPAGGRPARMRRLFEALADAIAAADRPLLLSGDCTSALGAVTGLQRRAGNLAVTWLDAHGDFNTPETTISGYLGGMALALLTGRAPELIGPPGLRPVAEDAAVLVGARDLDPAEREELAASRVRQVPADPGAIEAALRRLGTSRFTCTSTWTSSTAPSCPGSATRSARVPASGLSRTAWRPLWKPPTWPGPASRAPGTPTTSARSR